MFSPHSSLVRNWRAALLLVVVACATPDRASAECGDHVTILNTHAQVTADGHTSTSTTSGAAESPPTPKTPCSGPNCSRAPERHTPPAPSTTSGPHGKEANSVLGSVESSDPTSARVGEFLSPRPIRRATSVFHPPRLG